MNKRQKKMVNPNNFENFLDLIIKTAIAVGVSVSGYHLKRVGDDIDTLKSGVALHTGEIAVLKSVGVATESRLSRIETKLDSLLMEIKRK